MVQVHIETCQCCICMNHTNCVSIFNPKWICLMPKKINEIVIGPINYIQNDCYFEVTGYENNTFNILTKATYPNPATGMITLAVITSTYNIIRPGELLASMCTVQIDESLKQYKGKTLKISEVIFFFF